MFGFMKKHSEKDREEKERKKKEKKEKKEKKKAEKNSMTDEELGRLEQAKRSLFRRSSDALSDRSKRGISPQLSKDQTSDSSETSSVSSMGKPSPQDESKELVVSGATGTFTNQTKVELTKPQKPPPVMPKPTIKPKKGILKGKSSYGPEIPNQGVRGKLDDTETLVENTVQNEFMSGQVVKGKKGDASVDVKDGKPVPVARSGSQTKKMKDNRQGLPVAPPRGNGKGNSPPKASPPRHQTSQLVEPIPATDIDEVSLEDLIPDLQEKTFDADLKLPTVGAPRAPRARVIVLKRQPAGDFGFTLRRGFVLERGLGDNSETQRTVIFAEPGSGVKGGSSVGLLPGDRLIEVNNINAEKCNREEIIDLIKKSGDTVTVKVQPIPELSELSTRSGLDGEDVAIEDYHAKSGTLQRSGSMRYKNRGAKSEDRLASEKAWLSAEKVWLVHKGGFAGAKVLKQSDGVSGLAEGHCKVKLDHDDKELEVDEDDVEKANPPQYDRTEDLSTLRYLNMSSLLHTLRQRYGSNLIHTYSGRSLLVINPMHPLSIYSEKVIHMFKGCKQEDMPPHIYAAAQIAYRDMQASRQDQSIVLMGRSGSGKTTNMKHLLHYLTVAAGSVGKVLTVEKLNSIFMLLDAFGNSRTILNTSATRFTLLASLDFDQAGQIAAASIQVLMLEKSRVVRRPEGEPTFHIFYQMLAGMGTQLRNEFHLQSLNDPNLFMTPLQRPEDRQRATQAWAKIQQSLYSLGVKEEESKAIFAVLAAIYHLGVAGVVKGANNKYQFARPASAQRAAAVLGTSVEELARNIFAPAPTVQARGRGSPEKSPKSSPDTVNGLEALEGFVVGLYNEVFNAVVSLINRSLSSSYRTISAIIIVDSPGFQNPASCGRHRGASFEDLCHNYTQERLQQLYHDNTFTSHQDRYAQENIELDFDSDLSGPAAVVSLIDKPSQQTLVRTANKDLRDSDQRGLLWLLDEEAIFPGATDASFMERVLLHHGEGNERRHNLLKKGSRANLFVINHFQGTNPVQYNTTSWLKAGRENPLVRVAGPFLLDSSRQEITALFGSVRGPVSSTVSGSVVGIEGSSSLRRASSIRRSYTTGAAGLKRKSVCLQVKFQVDSVIETLRRTKVHFVLCLLPQHNAGLCDLKTSLQMPNKINVAEDVLLNVPLLRAQMKGSEVLEAIRIHRQGFPEHMLFPEFRHRFAVLLSPEAKLSAPPDEKQALEYMLEHLEVDKNTYRLGLSQVFFRAGALARLEDARDEKIADKIVAFQAYCRGYVGRKRLEKLKLQHLAVNCIQRNVRKFMGIREWPWWKLYTRIQPLLNVHRTEEELKNKDIELEQLKMKFEKSEKERNEYKHMAEKLEGRLCEVMADLAEEHTMSSQATEMLDLETADRMKLEKDLKELQTKYSNLQRRHEMAEIDLAQARLCAAQFDGELDEDETDDSIYRQKYERMRREADFTKKRLEQQHEEEVESQQAARKQLERKMMEMIEEMEEQKRQVTNYKRKAQRLTAEVQDMKHHLEEQQGRNSELEKKQRKFDLEVAKTTDLAKEEKYQKEKLTRERDELAAEKYSLEQELRNLKMDFELQTEKVERLERELRELSTSSRDDNELVNLKRLKNDLEQKVLEQEEELDEQAGSIQLLEQAKLRLEMNQEKLRQQLAKDLEEKETEMEEMRFSTQKKVKNLEAQIEEEYEEKQTILKEKRELERKFQALGEERPSRNKEVEKRLRRDLKRTKALLHDAQMMLDKNKEGAGGRNVIKQLRNQLEDSEFAKAAAVKARKGIEMEVQDLQEQLDEISKSKQELEDKCMRLSRDKVDLQSKMEDNEEDMAEVLKKYKAVVQQQTVDNITIQDQSKQIEELTQEKESLGEQITQLQGNLTYIQDSSVDKQQMMRLEARVRELESRLELETTTRQRAEAQLNRLREQLEVMTEEKDRLQESELHLKEVKNRLQKSLRDAQDEQGDLTRREAEASQRKHDLEIKVESLEADYEQSQADLRLAFKRIADLQGIIEEDMGSDDSDAALDSDLEVGEESDSDSDIDINTFLVNYKHSPAHVGREMNGDNSISPSHTAEDSVDASKMESST